MKLDAEIRRTVDDMRGPHADLFGVPLPFARIGTGKDRHVTAVLSGLLDEAAGRGAILKRRHDFKQNGADRKQRVFQAIARNIGIAVTDGQPHDRGDIADHRLKLWRNETDLPQPRCLRHARSFPF